MIKACSKVLLRGDSRIFRSIRIGCGPLRAPACQEPPSLEMWFQADEAKPHVEVQGTCCRTRLDRVDDLLTQDNILAFRIRQPTVPEIISPAPPRAVRRRTLSLGHDGLSLVGRTGRSKQHAVTPFTGLPAVHASDAA